MSKILLGVVTYGKQRYCLDEFCASLDSQTRRPDEILFVVNNGESAYGSLLKSRGLKVVEDSKPAKDRIEKIVSGRQFIRDYALKNGFDYVFFVDSDVILPPNALESLFAANLDVVSGVYLNVFTIENKPVIAPVLFRDVDGGAQLFTMAGVRGTKLLPIGAAGLGCSLVRSSVLEKVNFRFFESSRAGEDIAFYLDSRSSGFSTFAQTGVKCTHRAIPRDNPKSELFEWPIEAPVMDLNIDASSMFEKK